MRSLLIPAALAALVVPLAACEPVSLPLVALAVRDGQPIGILVRCGDDGFAGLSVYQDDDRERSTIPDSTLVAWRVHGTPGTDVVEAPLFGPAPEGFEVDGDTTVTDSRGRVEVRIQHLTTLRPGVRYAMGGVSGRQAIPVEFTTADFDCVRDDQVLAPVDFENARVMSRDSFVRAAQHSCGASRR